MGQVIQSSVEECRFNESCFDERMQKDIMRGIPESGATVED